MMWTAIVGYLMDHPTLTLLRGGSTTIVCLMLAYAFRPFD